MAHSKEGKMKEESTVFLCGYPKSGTTLLLSLLDNHLQLNTFPEELKTFSGVLKEKGLKNKINNILTKTGAYVPKVGIANYPSGVRDYSSVNGEEYIESLEKLLLKSTTDKELFTNIFKNWLLFSSNKKNFKTIKYNVEKTPHNELYSGIALRWFNNSKFIYIIRDPRDNYLSYKKNKLLLL